MQYLAIDIANHFGLDKETYETRIQWVKDNLNNLENHQDKAEEPVLFAKAVNALRQVQAGKPVGHTVAFDSVCSGLQLMSVVMRCKDGCSITGLIHQDERSDAYTSVTERMNDILKTKGKNTVSITRKQAKEGVMTALYGSVKVPERIFGSNVKTFYQALKETCKGAVELLELLRNSWNNKLAHEWIMPDFHHVYIPVMQTVEKRYKLHDIGYQPTVTINENIAKPRGISNIANAVHSLDAYVLRSLVRRCNYNPKQLKEFIKLNQTKKTIKTIDNEITTRYKETGIADISWINKINQDNIRQIPNTLRTKLQTICEDVLAHEPFEVICIHDSFACSPVHMNVLRKHYNMILADLSDSRVMDDIICQIRGLDRDSVIPNKGKTLRKYIEQANYGLC